MELIEISKRLENDWDEIANDEFYGSFMQSIAWGNFKKDLGQKVWNLAVVSNDKKKIFAIAQIIKEEIVGFADFLYCPYGPIFKKHKQKALKFFRKRLQKMLKDEKALFVRLEPKEILNFKNDFIFYPFSRQILNTLKLNNLDRTQEEILATFKPKTRYNLRLAEKKGVEISLGKKADLPIFIEFLKNVGQRADFTLPEKKYFYQMFDSLNSKNLMELLVAKYKNKIVGGFINIYFKDEATYLFGASDDNLRKLMINYPLMWETIKQAKAHNCKRLDFRGAAKNEIDEKDPFYGFTRFKRGFSPKTKIESYPGSYFLIANPLKFYLYYGWKIIRRRPL